jgi:glutamine cyclotransferase
MRKILALVSMCALTSVALAAGPPPPSSASPSSASLPTQYMYLATWPHTIHVIDMNQEKIVDNIDIPTDIARQIVLSEDQTKLYCLTLRDNSVVTIDLKTRKVIDSFSMNTPTENNKLSGLLVSPDGKTLYTSITTITKKLDHYDVGTARRVQIDMATHKIVYTAPEAGGGAAGGGGGRGGGGQRMSPDGKYLWSFGTSIQIYNASDYKLVKTIPLEEAASMQDLPELSLSVANDPNAPPGILYAFFNTTDPYVHKRTLGLAEIDLNKMTVNNMTEVAPAATGVQNLHLSPDRKYGYTSVTTGQYGDRVSEFWVFDMTTHKIIAKKEFPGRTRFSFELSADGKKLLIYNAGFSIEIYDAKTLSLTKVLETGGDSTSNLVVASLGKP